MMQSPGNLPEDENMATPPYFRSWRSIYLLVAVILIGLIGALFLFTRSYAAI